MSDAVGLGWRLELIRPHSKAENASSHHSRECTTVFHRHGNQHHEGIDDAVWWSSLWSRVNLRPPYLSPGYKAVTNIRQGGAILVHSRTQQVAVHAGIATIYAIDVVDWLFAC